MFGRADFACMRGNIDWSLENLATKMSTLVVAAVLAMAIGAPIASIVGDMTMPQPKASVRFLFLHTVPSTRIHGQSGAEPPYVLL